MIGNNLGIIEMALSGALMLGFCAWQYIAMTRSIARDRAVRDSAARDASTRPGHAEGEHRLDDR